MPHLTPYYQCVQDHFETFEQIYQQRFQKRYGFWRPYLREVIIRYLECGDLHNGFARIRCDRCGTERLLAFSWIWGLPVSGSGKLNFDYTGISL